MPRPAPVVAWPLALVLGVLLTACGGSDAQSTAVDRPAAVDVSATDCGSSWHPSEAGEQDVTLRNTDQNPGEVQVMGLGRHQGLVYADVEPFGPGTTVSLRVPLAAGDYALVCMMQDQGPVIGPTITVSGSAAGAPGVPILTQSQLVPSTLRYEAWTRRRLPALVRDVHRLRAIADRGDVGPARQAWLTAHLDYQRLGAAYEAFGDLGDEIDGLPSGLRGGTSSPHWTGFHRVERDLWGHADTARLRADVAVLDRAVSQLPGQLRSAQLDPLTLTLRAHEIAENALQFQLTGQDDFGSHTDLESVRAELVGTGAVLRAMSGPINRRVAHADRIRAILHRTLAACSHATRRREHIPVGRLPRAERERLDAALSLLTERLAAIPATLEPRLTYASQRLGAGGDDS